MVPVIPRPCFYYAITIGLRPTVKYALYGGVMNGVLEESEREREREREREGGKQARQDHHHPR